MNTVFGPVPSRRLGRSLGINNIPPKVCSYSCVYCQLGRAIEMSMVRRKFYDPRELIEETARRVRELRDKGEGLDYVTIVPDGEPTLDQDLGSLIAGLKELEVPVALITNSSLMCDPILREELHQLDWISLKIDSVDEATWRKIDRPHKNIDFKKMLNGMRTFAETFPGTLTTETMLVKGLNDGAAGVEGVADFLDLLEPAKSYISIPTRPPAEPWVEAPDEVSLAFAYREFSSRVAHVENLIGYEGNAFSFTGRPREDLLSITSVHPMRREVVEELLQKSKASLALLEELLQSGELVEVDFDEHRYYVRGFRR